MNEKILLITNDQALLSATSAILRIAGYDVITSDSGHAGFDLITVHTPGVIVCDISLPDIDGYCLMHLIQKNPKTAGIPVIVISAQSGHNEIRKAMDMGADDYLPKPCVPGDLLTSVEVRLKKIETLRVKLVAGPIQPVHHTNAPVHLTELTGPGRQIQHFKKKQAIYTRNQDPVYLFYIISGQVKTSRFNPDGKELITHISSNGSFLGYQSIIEHKTYSDTAEALDECEVMLIPINDFNYLLHNNISTANLFIKLLSSSLHEAEEQQISLAYSSLRKRVANGLLHVYNKLNITAGTVPSVEILREDLAKAIGTATESLIRTLSDFKSEKLIDVNGGKIILLDLEKLRNLHN